MKCKSACIVLSTIVFIFCVDVVSSESSPEKKANSGSTEKFVPTKEWQKVQKGQPLPAGLHYRLNINTGETEAKLLETPEGSKQDTKTGLVALPSQEDQDKSKDSPYMSKEELKRVLADITGDDVSPDTGESVVQDVQENEDKFRSYEDLKKEFKTLNITVKTDMEILNGLVKRARKFTIDTSSDEIVRTIRDLEYLVHQIDNAIEFIRLGGLSHIIVPSLNSTSAEVRAEALWLLGSAVQSNPKVQIFVLNAGIMPSLVKAAVLDPDVMVHARAVYALSCLTRQFPAAQAKLIAEGGLSSLSGIIDSKRPSDFKTKMRVITLLNDLLLERVDIRKAVQEFKNIDFSQESEVVQKVQQHKQGELKEKLRQYDAISLETRLVEDGWCLRLSEFLWMLYESGANSGRTQRRDDFGSVVSKDVPYRPEHDSVEKVLDTLHVMKGICQNEFKNDHKLVEVLGQFLSWYQELSIREEVLQKQRPSTTECSDSSETCSSHSMNVDDSEMYYSTIAERIKELLKFIKERYRGDSKDEL